MRACVRLHDRVIKTTEGSKCWRVSPAVVWGMLNADDAEVISHSPEQLRKVGMIVVVCTAFGLPVLEAKTEIVCLRTKGMP